MIWLWLFYDLDMTFLRFYEKFIMLLRIYSDLNKMCFMIWFRMYYDCIMMLYCFDYIISWLYYEFDNISLRVCHDFTKLVLRLWYDCIMVLIWLPYNCLMMWLNIYNSYNMICTLAVMKIVLQCDYTVDMILLNC